MSVQVKRRRESTQFLSNFVGAAGELIVDTTYSRVQVHDGVTPGGFPAARLNEVLKLSVATYNNVDATLYSGPEVVNFFSMSAPRTVTLCPASQCPVGQTMMIVDQSGACSPTNTITIKCSGSDTIDGASSFVLDAPYGAVALQSDSISRWTILYPAPQIAHAVLGVGTAPDPNNPLSVSANAALFNAKPTSAGGTGDFRHSVNKASPANTASLLLQDGFSARAEVGLCADDNFHVKVSPNGSAWSTGLLIDAATGALTPGNARTAIADANYAALVTDRLIAFASLTAARVVTLPAASAFPAGVPLRIADESGACSATVTIAIAPAGTDLINGAASATLSLANASLTLVGDGANAWTVVEQSAFNAIAAAGQATFAGKIGIGTTAPAAPLDVAGTMQTHAPNGSTMQFCIAETLVDLSGAATSAPIPIPANCLLLSVAAYVVEAISGAPSFGVGVAGNPTQFGGALSVAQGASNFGLIGPEPFYAATPLLVTATSGAFAGGQVRLALHYMLLGGPTS